MINVLNVESQVIQSILFNTVKGATCHENLYYKNKTTKNTCDICGKTINCYAF